MTKIVTLYISRIPSYLHTILYIRWSCIRQDYCSKVVFGGHTKISTQTSVLWLRAAQLTNTELIVCVSSQKIAAPSHYCRIDTQQVILFTVLVRYALTTAVEHTASPSARNTAINQRFIGVDNCHPIPRTFRSALTLNCVYIKSRRHVSTTPLGCGPSSRCYS